MRSVSIKKKASAAMPADEGARLTAIENYVLDGTQQHIRLKSLAVWSLFTDALLVITTVVANSELLPGLVTKATDVLMSRPLVLSIGKTVGERLRPPPPR